MSFSVRGTVPAIGAGQHEIENDEVGAALLQHRLHLPAITRSMHSKAVAAEKPGDEFKNLPVVIDHQNALCALLRDGAGRRNLRMTDS